MSNLQNNNYKKEISLGSISERLAVFGTNDLWLNIIEKQTSIQIHTRDENIVLLGEQTEVNRIYKLFMVLIKIVKNGYQLSERDIYYALDLLETDSVEELLDLYNEKIATTYKGKDVLVKSLGQKHYISSIKRKDIVFGIGPAGTGKTYLAVVMAVTALKKVK